MTQRGKSREVSQLQWIIGKLPAEEAGYRLVEVAGYFRCDPGVMSRGVRLLEERLIKEKELQKRFGRLQVVIREGRKPRIARRQACDDPRAKITAWRSIQRALRSTSARLKSSGPPVAPIKKTRGLIKELPWKK